MPSTLSTRTLPSTSITPAPRPRPRPRYKKAEAPPSPPKIVVSSLPIAHLPVNDAEDSDVSPLSSPVEHKAANISPTRKHTSGLTETPRKRRPQVDQDTWDIDKLGPYVWVLIDRRARIFDSEDLDDMHSHSEWLWWPGKINRASSRKKPLKVRLYGTAAPGVKTIEIHNPCESNIVALESSQHRISLDEPTFVNLGFCEENILDSPRKKQKVDRESIKERWLAARQELAQEKAEEGGSDAMPEVGTLDFQLFVSSTPTKTTKETTPRQKQKVTVKGKGKRKRRGSGSESDANDREMVKDERDDGPDALLTIPGEGVFAAASAARTTYWPARILSYVPPRNARQGPKYEVKYLDDRTPKFIPREWFYTVGQNEFGTCKLGQWESIYEEVQNDEDDDDDAHHNNLHSRSPSPIPTDPPPEVAAFVKLSMHMQFAFVKPVLVAILHDGYTPARTCHDKFIAGGSRRQGVVEGAGLRGQMDPRDVVHLQECLVQWCLRDERKAKAINDEESSEGEGSLDRSVDNETPMVDAPPSRRLVSPTGSDVTVSPSPSEVPPPSSFVTEESELPSTSVSGTSIASFSSKQSSPSLGDARSSQDRQRGCEAYEGLSAIEKLDYCHNVLLPETVLQVLLWRGGHRRSINLLSEAEEAELHQKGKELLQESDWVNDIMRLREQLEKTKATNSRAGRSGDGEPLLSVTGRPRRSVGAPKSYQE